MLLEGQAHTFDLLPDLENEGNSGALLWLKGEKEKQGEKERQMEEGFNEEAKTIKWMLHFGRGIYSIFNSNNPMCAHRLAFSLLNLYDQTVQK